ncbi:unnamed protein product, partial [Cuscuta epithymum]
MTDNFTSLTNKYRHCTYKLSVRQTSLFILKTHPKKQENKIKNKKIKKIRSTLKSFKTFWSTPLSFLLVHLALPIRPIIVAPIRHLKRKKRRKRREVGEEGCRRK